MLSDVLFDRGAAISLRTLRSVKNPPHAFESGPTISIRSQTHLKERRRSDRPTAALGLQILAATAWKGPYLRHSSAFDEPQALWDQL